jgi:hypothetical protein
MADTAMVVLVCRVGGQGGAVALMDRETRFTGVGVGSLVRSRRRVHRKLPPDVGADVGLRLRARNDRVADSG